MAPDDNLLQGLPANLDGAIRKNLAPDESLIITLPGAYGEALAVTDRRAIVVREALPPATQPSEIECYAHPFGTIKEVKVDVSGLSGNLMLMTEPQLEVEKSTVFFPSYDRGRFESAAAKIKDLLRPVPVAATSPTQAPTVTNTASSPSVNVGNAGVSANRCPSCGNNISDFDAFCRSCGARVAWRCAYCNSTSLMKNDKFCNVCGEQRTEAPSTCEGCGKPLFTRGNAFCPSCGRKIYNRCGSCGADVLPGWKFCSNCGREIGSLGRITGRESALRFAETASDEVMQTVGGTASVEEIGSAPDNTAEAHNATGEIYFEQDKVDEAMDEFQKAIMIDPSVATYHYNLAVVYDDKGMTDQAQSQYEKALELDPNDTKSMLYLGYIYSEREMKDRAAQLWRKVTFVAPGSAEAIEAEDNLRHLSEL